MTPIASLIAPSMVQITDPVAKPAVASVEGDFSAAFSDILEEVDPSPESDLAWSVMPESPSETLLGDAMLGDVNSIEPWDTLGSGFALAVMTGGEALPIGAFSTLNNMPAQQEMMPAPLEETPARLELMPVPLEKTPARLEVTPVPLEKMIAPLETVQVPLEKVPVPLETLPLSLMRVAQHLDLDRSGLSEHSSESLAKRSDDVTTSEVKFAPRKGVADVPTDHAIFRSRVEHDPSQVTDSGKVPVLSESGIGRAAAMISRGFAEQSPLPHGNNSEGLRLNGPEPDTSRIDIAEKTKPLSFAPNSEPSNTQKSADGKEQSPGGSHFKARDIPESSRVMVRTGFPAIMQEMPWSILVTDALLKTKIAEHLEPQPSLVRITANGSTYSSSQLLPSTDEQALQFVPPDGRSADLPSGSEKVAPAQLVPSQGSADVALEMRAAAEVGGLPIRVDPEASLKQGSEGEETIDGDKMVTRSSVAQSPDAAAAPKVDLNGVQSRQIVLPEVLTPTSYPSEGETGYAQVIGIAAPAHPLILSLSEVTSGERSPPLSPRTETPSPQAQIVAAMTTGSKQTVELLLSPEELGQVRIDMSHDAERLVVSISAERQETLDLLRRNADQLVLDLRMTGQGGVSLSFGRWAGANDHGPSYGAATTTDGEDCTPEPNVAPTQLAMQPIPPRAGLYLRI